MWNLRYMSESLSSRRSNRLRFSANFDDLGIAALTIDKITEGATPPAPAVVPARTLAVLEPLCAFHDPGGGREGFLSFRVRDSDRTLLTIDFTDIPTRTLHLMCRAETVRGESCWRAFNTRRRLFAGRSDPLCVSERTRCGRDPMGGLTVSVTARLVFGCDCHAQPVSRDAAREIAFSQVL